MAGSVILPYDQAVDIGGGRGRLHRDAAASLARVDRDMRSAYGRAADINEAWRSPETADENYRAYQAWLAYQNGRGPKVPWAPLAFAAKDSIHCRGFAVDTDDTTDAQMRIWNNHGWYWTVYRDGKLIERWHLEYFADRDNRRHEGVPASVPTTSKEWDEMASEQQVEEAAYRAARKALQETLGDSTPRGTYIWTLNRGGALVDPSFGAIALAGEEAETAREIYGHGPEMNDRQWDVAFNLAQRLAEQNAAMVAKAIASKQAS
jgi:hypothetical protein